MSKTKYLVISAVVVAAIAATPLVISQKVDSAIEANKVLLAQNGLKQDILSKSGYFTSQRTFSLEVADAKKARDFLLAKLIDKNAQYKLFVQSLKDETDGSINAGFDGLKFKGEMTHSNLLPSDVKISLSLDQLPKSLQDELANDKAASDAILPLLARGVLAVDMTFGSDEKLKDVRFKDIKEQIKTEGSTLNIDTEKQLLTLNENGGVVQGVLGVGKQNFGVDSEMFVFKSELKDFVYNFSYKDDLNNKGDIKIGKYTLEVNDEYSNTKFDLGSLKANSSVEDVKKDLQIKADYTLDNIVVNNSSADVTLEKLFAKLFLRGINSDTMKKVQADYNTLLLGATTPDDKVLIDDFVALVNHGVKLDLGIALKGLNSDMMNLKDVSVDTTLEIVQNQYTDKESPLALLGLLDITSKVKVHKDDRATLEAMGLTSAEDFALGKPEGDFFIYEIAMKKGAISVNGKTIQ
ncbi:YdgA family protein [Sulfurospirillum oryzae]|uniref:YdgA family protein n=1 Tax=Sulfurospirillum oryzae TaxID=2976535 RepID=UPI0021E8D1B0|nr:YdgA family protein [Sulfurospirillum oryzae]